MLEEFYSFNTEEKKIINKDNIDEIQDENLKK